MFSRRAGWSTRSNRLAAAIAARRRTGSPLLDLTVSNPTLVGIPYPVAAIREALSAGAAERYDPDPLGDARARRAVAEAYAAEGIAVEPERIVLCASTSEAYGWLFKLLADPAGKVLVPRPSYPLFEFLAGLESVEPVSYPLRFDGRWEIDGPALVEHLDDLGPTARAVVAVNPNNPTGSFLSRAERSLIEETAESRGLPVVSDEVFRTYTIGLADAEGERRGATFLGRHDAATFVLDGLSKSAGLPEMKVAWIVVQGPATFRDEALARLELIADTYLSVAQPAQRALGRLLEIGAGIAARIRERVRANAAALDAACGAGSACRALPVEGGWSAVLRVPRTRSEERWCLELLDHDGVVVQPGYFYDFETEAYLVVSLLVEETTFARGIARVVARAAA